MKKIIEPFKHHLGNSEQRSKLLRKIVNTRNYLTHYSEGLQTESAEGSELWTLCLKMEAMFNLHFMKMIGFSDEEITHVVENSHSLKWKLKVGE